MRTTSEIKTWGITESTSEWSAKSPFCLGPPLVTILSLGVKALVKRWNRQRRRRMPTTLYWPSLRWAWCCLDSEHLRVLHSPGRANSHCTVPGLMSGVFQMQHLQRRESSKVQKRKTSCKSYLLYLIFIVFHCILTRENDTHVKAGQRNLRKSWAQAEKWFLQKCWFVPSPSG